jgi:hypothetical protein
MKIESLFSALISNLVTTSYVDDQKFVVRDNKTSTQHVKVGSTPTTNLD